MPAELDSPATPAAGLRLAASALTELAFSLFTIERNRRHPEKGVPDWLVRLEAAEPGLCERVATFWDDERYDEWGELMVVAWHAGTLADDDLGPLLERLDEVLVADIVVPELSTEPDDVRALIASRLRRLRDDAALRARYVDLLGDVWRGFAPVWREDGRRTARTLAIQFRDQIASGRTLDEAVSKTHIACRLQFRPLVERALASGELLVAPLGLAPEGQFVFGLPGVLVLGFGGESDQRFDRYRELAERAAQRFKVLSDPTRAAILSYLVDCPQTIGDLATQFELSQPTVSVHIKLLRQAALLEWEKRGSATLYRSRPELLREFVGTAQEWLLGGTRGEE